MFTASRFYQAVNLMESTLGGAQHLPAWLLPGLSAEFSFAEGNAPTFATVTSIRRRFNLSLSSSVALLDFFRLLLVPQYEMANASNHAYTLSEVMYFEDLMYQSRKPWNRGIIRPRKKASEMNPGDL